MSSVSVPMPPLELRRIVGPTDPEDFDNPRGERIYEGFGLPREAYDAVFDFGCGCGREARRLLLQDPRPRRYVGVDAHKTLIRWCQQNLSPVASGFEFVHHDVYSPLYSPENKLQLTQPFPVGDGEFSLVVAISVFTHLCRQQTEYYLAEVARILASGGAALTTWFFFDRASFPFLQDGPYCLYTSETNFAQAVVYDRQWFLDTVRSLGLRVRSTTPPVVAGHQWTVFLEQRLADAGDRFPLGGGGSGVGPAARPRSRWPPLPFPPS